MIWLITPWKKGFIGTKKIQTQITSQESTLRGGLPIFENSHGTHLPSPWAISEYYVGIMDEKGFTKLLRQEADWIISKLKKESKKPFLPTQTEFEQFYDASMSS